MAKGSNSDEVKRATLLVPRAEAQERIRAQIEKGTQLLSVQIKNRSEFDEAWDERRKWSDYNSELLKRIVDTDDLARDYSSGGGPLSWVPMSFEEQVRDFYYGIRSYINRLESILGRLELVPEPKERSEVTQSVQTEDSGPGDEIFVVHGHDEEAKQSAARCIEKLGLKATILHEQPNQGRTIIEKFEDYADVGFAVVLLTPDDVGTSKQAMDDLQPRARQNVILELGFFIGKLGRDRVCALHKGDVEIPSDFSGVLWVPMDQGGAWQVTLAREIRAAGLDVDLNKLAE